MIFGQERSMIHHDQQTWKVIFHHCNVEAIYMIDKIIQNNQNSNQDKL